jgi:hypothetical protein
VWAVRASTTAPATTSAISSIGATDIEREEGRRAREHTPVVAREDARGVAQHARASGIGLTSRAAR